MNQFKEYSRDMNDLHSPIAWRSIHTSTVEFLKDRHLFQVGIPRRLGQDHYEVEVIKKGIRHVVVYPSAGQNGN